MNTLNIKVYFCFRKHFVYVDIITRSQYEQKQKLYLKTNFRNDVPDFKQ